MKDAITLVEYFRGHAARVLPALQAMADMPAAGLRVRIERVLERSGSEWTPQREIYRSLGAHVPIDDVTSVLDELQSEGLVERHVQPAGPRGGRPSPQWRITYSAKTSKRQNPSD